MTDLTFKTLTAGNFVDFERLFGPRGACAGCWCTFWKLRGKAYSDAAGDKAHDMQKIIVESGEIPGLLAYDGDQPVGWIAVEPRSAYPKLAHSRVLVPVDDQPVWSVTCFFVEKNYRRQGLTVFLLGAAIKHVRSLGGRIVEGYPVDAKDDAPAPFIFTGTASAFRQAGFKEVARNSPARPIFRYFIEAE